jgi:hypothetical protein
MLSKNPSPLSALEFQSRDLETPVRARLELFCADPTQHARFLNMLSLMEHIGSRKIMATQSGTDLDNGTLKHLAEEARHAFFFKRAAEKFARKPLDYSDAETLAAPFARAYMGRLDASIAGALGDGVPSALPYLYMSLIVELRAIWFYRLYQAALDECKTGLALKSVLAEEELHLSEMLAQLDAMDAQGERRIAAFTGIEARLFRTLWRAVEEAGGHAPEAVA